MDRGWSTVPAAVSSKCNCRYCRAGCFHVSRGSASSYQRQHIPYIQPKKLDVVHMRRNGGLPAGRAPCTEPDWAQRQAGRIRAWRQAEKIRAWRQALNKEVGQAESGDQTEGKTGEDPELAASGGEEACEACVDAGLPPSEDEPEATPAEQPHQALNGDGEDQDISPSVCQVSVNAGDVHLSSSSEPGTSDLVNTMGEQSELSTDGEQGHVEKVAPIKKKEGNIKRDVSVPTDKTWALEQAARIKAWREAKTREVTEAPGSLTVEAVTEEDENLPVIQAP